MSFDSPRAKKTPLALCRKTPEKKQHNGARAPLNAGARRNPPHRGGDDEPPSFRPARRLRRVPAAAASARFRSNPPSLLCRRRRRSGDDFPSHCAGAFPSTVVSTPVNVVNDVRQTNTATPLGGGGSGGLVGGGVVFRG